MRRKYTRKRDSSIVSKDNGWWVYSHPGVFWIDAHGLWSGDDGWCAVNGDSIHISEHDKFKLLSVDGVKRMAEIFQP